VNSGNKVPAMRDKLGNRGRLLVVLASVCALAMGIAACGGSSSNSTPVSTVGGSQATSPTVAAGVASAKQDLNPFLTEPKSLTGLTPLPSKPTQKTIGIVSCSEPLCAVLAGYIKDAASELGWKSDMVIATATDPGAAIQQLISAGVNYIAENAYDANTFAPQMQELRQKKIPLFEIASTDPAEGPKNGIYADISGGTSQYQWGEIETDWAIADSNGHADILDVNTPDYPVLVAQANGEKAAIKKNCPECKFNALDVTVNDLTTNAIPGLVVSYLQSNPGIHYIHFTDEQNENGVVSALRTAGLLNKVKIYGSSPQASQFKEIADGDSAAWQVDPQPQAFWAVVDQMTRVATETWSEKEANQAALVPWFLLTDKARAAEFAKSSDPYPWPGPAGYQQTYKKLWKLG
jgi:ribose transport system substrate-binding protein